MGFIHVVFECFVQPELRNSSIMILRKSVLLTICILFSVSALAAGNRKTDWSHVIEAIIHVESRGDVNAKCGKYAGAMQIAPIVVKECNIILQERNVRTRYTLSDRYDLKKAKEMFRLFQEKYNPTNDVEYAIRLWNGGPRFNKKATNGYFNRVVAAMTK